MSSDDKEKRVRHVLRHSLKKILTVVSILREQSLDHIREFIDESPNRASVIHIINIIICQIDKIRVCGYINIVNIDINRFDHIVYFAFYVICQLFTSTIITPITCTTANYIVVSIYSSTAITIIIGIVCFSVVIQSRSDIRIVVSCQNIGIIDFIDLIRNAICGFLGDFVTVLPIIAGIVTILTLMTGVIISPTVSVPISLLI